MMLSDDRSDNKGSFEDLLVFYLDDLYAWALRLTRQPANAEDLVQDCVVKALRFRDRFVEGGNIKAWLFRIMTRVFFNAVRKDRTLKRVLTEAVRDHRYSRFISSASMIAESAETNVWLQISAERVQEALNELGSDFRMVIILSDYHGFSYKEIAEIVDCPVGTVMSRLFRGRRQLQEKLCGDARADLDSSLERGSSGDAPADLISYRARRESRGR